MLEELRKNREITIAVGGLVGTLLGYYIGKEKGDSGVGSILGGFAGSLGTRILIK